MMTAFQQFNCTVEVVLFNNGSVLSNV